MTATISVYTGAFGDVLLPEPIPVRMKSNHWPDRRFKDGRRFDSYLRHIDKLAERAFHGGRTLKRAPAFSKWVTK
jgi:hypothetical protein